MPFEVNVIIRKFLLLLGMFVFTNYTHAKVETDSNIYKEAITQLNQTTKGNVASTVVWFVRRMDQKSLTPLLDAVWRMDRKELPELPWKQFEETEVRVRFANLYAIWVRVNDRAGRGLEEIDSGQRIEAIRAYVTKYRLASDRDLRAHAITFSASSDTCDLKELISIALEDDPTLSMLAINTIVKIRGSKARSVLLSIKKKIKNEYLLDSIRQNRGQCEVTNRKPR